MRYAAQWVEKIQPQEGFPLMTQDSIGYLKNALHERFYRWAVTLSLNGNATANGTMSQKC